MPPDEALTPIVCVETVLGVVPTDSTTVRTGVLATHDLSELQAAFSLPAPPVLVLAKGCVVPDDDGGGAFYWEPGGGIDDGGTFIVPGGNVSATGAGWRRIWRDRMNIRWFGAPAVYNATLSTHYPIQLAVDAAVTATSGGIYTSPPVYFPPGSYWLAEAVDVRTANLIGDNVTIEPSGGGAPDALLKREYKEGWIEGFNFKGGVVQLQIYGGGGIERTNEQQLRISNCTFRGMKDCAIVVEEQNTIHLVVEHFTFAGPRFFRGAPEDLTIRVGFVAWHTPDYDASDRQNNYCFVINYTNAVLEDLVGAPTGAATDDVAWILVNGGVPGIDPPATLPGCRLLCRHVRFGGEGGGASIVHVISRDLEGTVKTTSSTIELYSCPMYAAQKHWMKIFDVFPSTIRVKGVDEAGALDPSFGVYVSAAAANSLIGRHAVEVDLEANVSGWQGGTFRQDLGDGRFKVLNNTLMTQFDDRLYEATSGLPDVNYFVAGTYSPEAPFTTLLDGTTLLTVSDSFAGGRVLPIFQAPSTGKGHVWYASPAWGDGVAAGTYCFSVYVRSINGQSTVRLNYKDRRLRQMRIGPSGVSFQRAFASFYHDGSAGNNLVVEIDEIDPNGAVAFGFFCVSSGTTPAPYLFPGNRWTGLVLPEAYYAGSPPAAVDGTYKQGDIVWNTAPSAGGVIGFVCVASGSPGTWKGFGKIEP